MTDAPTPTATDPLATAADLAAFTRGAVEADDPRVAGALAAVSGLIRRYLGWHLTPVVSEALVVDGEGGTLLELPTRHLTAVAGIVDDGYALEPTGYRWSALGLVRRKSATWSEEYAGIVATVSHGFTDCPPEVRQVVLSVAARLLSSPTGAKAESAGGETVSWATADAAAGGGMGMLGSELSALEPYRVAGV